MVLAQQPKLHHVGLVQADWEAAQELHGGIRP